MRVGGYGREGREGGVHLTGLSTLPFVMTTIKKAMKSPTPRALLPAAGILPPRPQAPLVDPDLNPVSPHPNGFSFTGWEMGGGGGGRREGAERQHPIGSCCCLRQGQRVSQFPM
jgi:hypothetical protein